MNPTWTAFATGFILGIFATFLTIGIVQLIRQYVKDRRKWWVN